ncbi:M15 family metallopeptidase [Dolichospermum compactum]|uniref:D-alanyl-D-alanine dipeptidase n=1 Tax=Dolichospermum compactum NIES-806 TaxID=1973481 RepID=A0A1Z4UZF5_9CYAN|nr:M15 family metallopeptidase [Dolichospermum compactum]BAZ84626.1 peptidase M15D vanX D-ala-D-ala dipeptidase [Dolichospermum compactum NIES-806]
MRPYHQIPIIECGEPLVKVPLELFAVESPHPYQKLGANYGGHSPYYLRQSVVENLIQAQNNLQLLCPNWYIQIFDAYRPVAVQQFMVDYSFGEALRERGLTEKELSPQQREDLWKAVYEIWAVPSLDMNAPPPHSTGAAVDITLVNDFGEVVDMGSPIDEMSDRSHPEYYTHSHQEYDANRQLLRDVMLKAGFQRNPREWWHFSFGDQMWAWLYNQSHPQTAMKARYGRLS